MAKTSKTTAFLKECLADALLKLMKEKPLEKIAVWEIAETAGVGRATWFRNFSAKEEAITYKLTCLWRRFEAELGQGACHYRIGNALDFFRFNYTIRHLHLMIYGAGLQTAIYDAFYQIMMPQLDADVSTRYRNKFFSYGLFGLLDEWVKCDFRETPEEMARLYRRALRGGLGGDHPPPAGKQT